MASIYENEKTAKLISNDTAVKNAIKTQSARTSGASRGGGGGSGGASAGAAGIAGGARRTGTPDYSDPYYDNMERFYAQVYQNVVAANNAAASSVSGQAEEAAQARRQELNMSYQDMNRQLYRDFMDTRRTLSQQMAAQGYSGGLSESSLVRLQSVYGDNLAANERARLASLAGVDSELAQQQYETRTSAANANTQALQYYYTRVAALRSAQHSQLRADQKTRASVLSTAGDYSGYGELGFSDEDIAYLANMWRAKNPKIAYAQATGPVG